ncbi:winged helix-turn-helix domain-containing protein [Microvirga calopogonii]|uniref:winged helix-turn-helix domain-containing protein n=1 Tax=Microvirga calopogonii TaxID=2078013 RepID=UPI0013B40F0B|nr:winged helix-turn-helix domain-containing protein [Microvirga calopogonii]
MATKKDLPHISAYLEVVLQLLRIREAMTVEELEQATADSMSLGPELRTLRTEDGFDRLHAYRLGWALSGLAQAGAVAEIGTGVIRITPVGARMSETDLADLLKR